VADHIDGARNPARGRVDADDGIAREDTARISASQPDSSGDISARLLQGESGKPAAQRNALLQLREMRLVQAVRQFELAGKYELELFVCFGLEIGKQPQFFQHIVRQALCFVDDEYCGSSPVVALLQERFEF